MNSIVHNGFGSDESGGLRKVTVSLGWDAPPENWRNGADDIDCDLSAFLFVGGKLHDTNDVIYFANTAHSSGAVVHSGDNLDGDDAQGGEKDNETIEMDLTALPDEYEKIIFTVNIYGADKKRQTFGDARNAFFRAKDQTGETLCFMDLTGQFPDETAIAAARLYRDGTKWKFHADGTRLEIEEGGIAQIAAALRDLNLKK